MILDKHHPLSPSLIIHSEGILHIVQHPFLTFHKPVLLYIYFGIDFCSYNVYICNMKSVGIRELKNKLSKYLRLVKDGEVIIVTDRNEIVAEIKQPIPNESDIDSDIMNYLNEQEEKGKILRAVRTKSVIDTIIKSEGKKRVSVDWKGVYQKTREDRP